MALKPPSRGKRKRISPEQEANEWIFKNDDPPGFDVEVFPGKGRGVVSTVPREKGDFLLVYKGDYISEAEGERREKADGGSGYRFFFNYKERTICIDATAESKYLGRLVNHGKKKEQNSVMKQISGNLCLFATRNINIGEEILYDYGLKNLPWEQKISKKSRQREFLCDPSTIEDTDASTTKDVAAPTTKNVATSNTKSVITPTTEDIITPTTEDIITPTTENIITPTTEDIITPKTEDIITPTTKDIITPTTEDIITPTTENIVTLTIDYFIPSTTEDIVTPITEDVVPSTIEMVITPTAKDVVTPSFEVVNIPTTEDIITPTTDDVITFPNEDVYTPTTEDVFFPTTEDVIPPTTEDVFFPTTEGVYTPTTEDVIPPTTEDVIPPTTEGVFTPTTEGVFTSTTEDVITSTTEGVFTSTTEDVITPTTEGVCTPTTEDVIPPTTEGVFTPTTEGVFTSTTEDVITPSTEVVFTSTTENVITPTTEGVFTSTTDNVFTPNTEDVITLTTEGVFFPTTETVFTPTTEEIITPKTEGVFTPSTEGVFTPSTEGVFTSTTEDVITPTTEVVFTPSTEGVITPTTEGVFTSTTEDVFTPNTEGVFTPNTEDVFTPNTEDVFTPNTEDVITPTTEDVFTPNTEDVFTLNTKDVFTPYIEDVFTSTTEDVFTPNTEDVFSPNTEDVITPTTGGVITSTMEWTISQSTKDAITPITENVIARATKEVIESESCGDMEEPSAYNVVNNVVAEVIQERLDPVITSGVCDLVEKTTDKVERHGSQIDVEKEDMANEDVTITHGIKRSGVEPYTIFIEDLVSSSLAQEGCTTMYVKKKDGILQTEEYVSDSDCSDIVPVYTAIPLEKVLIAAADSTCPVVEEEKPKLKTNSDDIKIQVVTSSDKRDYDKKHACYFCPDKKVLKMARHLETEHSNVYEIGSLPKYDKKDTQSQAKRKTVFSKYRNLGDFNNNVKVLREKSGILHVGRRPQNGKAYSASEYLPCQYCLVFFLRSELWRHIKHCQFRNNKISYEMSEVEKRSSVKAGESLLQGALGQEMFSSSQECGHFRESVLDGLRGDDVSRCIKSDELLLLFGKVEFNKLGTLRASQVREKLRILGRLKLLLRKISGKNSASIGDFITVECFDMCITAIRQLAGISDEPSLSGTKTYNKPTLALKSGEFLVKLAGLKRGQAIRKRDIALRDDTAEFIDLYKADFKTISSVARQTVKERKFNKKALLPLTEDLLKYAKHLEDKMTALTSDLQASQGTNNWRDLAKVTLARVLFFNKRRSDETARMLVHQYQTRPRWIDEDSELVKSLKPIEKNMLKHMDLVEVLGKNGKRVPVLLTKSMVAALDAIVSYRMEAGVSNCNPYVFAEGDFNHMKGSACIRKTTHAANLQYPERVTSTKLRKYLATVSQIFNLSNCELEELARHMGHELSVHRNFYRLQEDVIELAKVSRLLLAVEEGKAHTFSGCSLDDINVADIEIDEDKDLTESVEVEYENNEEEESNDGIQDFDVENPDFNNHDDQQEVNDCQEENDVENATLSHDNSGLKLDGKEQKEHKGAVKRTVWTNEEKHAIKQYLLPNVEKTLKPPRKEEILLVQSKNVLQSRTWKQIKYETWAIHQKNTKVAKQIREKLLRSTNNC